MTEVTVFDYLSNREVVTTIENCTGLHVGMRVTHINAGKHGGHGPNGAKTVTKAPGTILTLEDNGEYFWGGRCFTAVVKWDNGEEYRLVTSLLKVC